MTKPPADAPTPTPFDPSAYPAPDLESPQLTLRAVLAGCLFGGVLSLCNIYAGLKIGWAFNMSITAMLLAFGFFRPFRPMSMLENNVNQTTASAAASISSAGLVSAIPAFTILTGEKLGWGALALWTAAVSFVGVVVAIGLRRQMIVVDKLAFPGGIASAETIKQIYAHGREAMARVKMLLGGAAVGAAVKLVAHLAKVAPLGLPGAVAGKAGGSYTLANLGFALEPSVMMVGVGAIIGTRAGVSLLAGAVVSWGLLAPIALDAGWAQPGAPKPDASWFGALNKWMLWPGVAMMVASSLTSFAFSGRSMWNALRRPAGGGEDPHDVPRKVFVGALLTALVFASVTETVLFGVPLWLSVASVLFTFVLAVVAGRVAGETGVTPVGPMGKVTQLLFGVLRPGDVAGNLMAANVTGGAASQCADLLQDLKTGALIGASPRAQAVGQSFGVVAGATIGSAGYLLLVPDPKAQLLSEQWPAPAVAAWKAVAELFREGFQAMPNMAMEAMGIAAALGVALAIAEKVLPKGARGFVPSPGSLGLAMVVPAVYSIAMFLGAMGALAASRVRPVWAASFLIVLASGLIAGESIVGVGLAVWETVKGIAGG